MELNIPLLHGTRFFVHFVMVNRLLSYASRTQAYIVDVHKQVLFIKFEQGVESRSGQCERTSIGACRLFVCSSPGIDFSRDFLYSAFTELVTQRLHSIFFMFLSVLLYYINYTILIINK